MPVEKVSELREWFRNYKTAEGKGQNEFGLDEKAMPRKYAEAVVEETHEVRGLLAQVASACRQKSSGLAEPPRPCIASRRAGGSLCTTVVGAPRRQPMDMSVRASSTRSRATSSVPWLCEDREM